MREPDFDACLFYQYVKYPYMENKLYTSNVTLLSYGITTHTLYIEQYSSADLGSKFD